MKKLSLTVVWTLFAAMPWARADTTLITNGTFETGTLAGWTTTETPYMDVTGSCNDGFAAQSAATGCTSGTNPAFGTYAAYSSTTFPTNSDSVGEWENYLTQNFTVPANVSSGSLSLEWTATWGGFGSFRGASVYAEIVQGTISQQVLFVDNPASSGSVGWTLSTTDLTSLLQADEGQTLSLWLVSGAYYVTQGSDISGATTVNTGFDNVQITVQTTPEPGTLGLAAAGFLVAAWRLRRRKGAPPRTAETAS